MGLSHWERPALNASRAISDVKSSCRPEFSWYGIWFKGKETEFGTRCCNKFSGRNRLKRATWLFRPIRSPTFQLSSVATLRKKILLDRVQVLSRSWFGAKFEAPGWRFPRMPYWESNKSSARDFFSLLRRSVEVTRWKQTDRQEKKRKESFGCFLNCGMIWRHFSVRDFCQFGTSSKKGMGGLFAQLIKQVYSNKDWGTAKGFENDFSFFWDECCNLGMCFCLMEPYWTLFFFLP